MFGFTVATDVDFVVPELTDIRSRHCVSRFVSLWPSPCCVMRPVPLAVWVYVDAEADFDGGHHRTPSCVFTANN